MASIDPPKSAGPPTELRISIGAKSLKLSSYETSDTITIFIGGHDVYCIEAMIYKEDSIFVTRLGYSANIGLLTQVYYNLNCSLEGNFQKGVDTSRILHILCKYIRRNYPYVNALSFTDASYKTCDNGHDVELAEMTYMRTGKTWYEKNYGAYIDNKYAGQISDMEQKFTNAKKHMTWKDFSQFIVGAIPLSEEELEHMYTNALTWQQFFGPLSEKMGISQFCIFVAPWLHKFFNAISNVSFASFKYILPLDKIPNIEYTISNYMRGGRKFTQKRIRKKKVNYQ